MEESRSIWRAAACEAELGEARTRRLERACGEDPPLAEELDFLVAHLSANLGGTFLRAFAAELKRGAGSDVALISALDRTIRATPSLRRGVHREPR